jgi:archaellum component FlaC
VLEIKFDNVAIDSNGIKGLSNTYELYKDNFYLGAVASNTFKLEVAKHLMPSKPTEVKIEDDNNNYVLEVDKIEETDNSYEIELTDKMLRFNFLYDAKPLIDENRVDGESTTTIQDILNDICDKADIECNYTLTTANHIVDWWDNRISARDYISMIAEKEATFVRFENDELMFIPVNSPSKKTINEDEIDELKIGEGRKITRVVYDNGVGTFWEFGDESGNTLYLDPNNVFILDENDVEDIYNKIKDFEFYSITVGNCPIDSSVLAGDVIKFKDRNDNEYPTIAQYNLSYFGGWLGGYSLDIKSTTQEETSVLGVFDSVKSIRTEIDRTNNELKIIAEEVGENSSKISTMEQTVDGFTQTVQKVETLETQVSDLENDIDNIELQRPFYRYSANSDGSNMTESPQANTKYLGTYVGISAPTINTEYTWTLIKGADGEKGADGTDGKDGKDGKTLFLAYADNIDDYEGFSTDGADSNKDYYGMFVGHEQSLDPLDYEWYPSNYKIENELDEAKQNIESTNETTTEIMDNIETINQALTTMESTILTQTNQEFLMWFEQTGLTQAMDALGNIVDATNEELQTMSQYIRFISGNIELGKSDSQVKLILRNDRISFMTGTNESAYISDNKLYITDSTILTRLQVGNFVDEVDDYGNLNTRWID